MSHLRAFGITVIAVLARFAPAQQDDHWLYSVGPVLSFKVLGSEDARHGYYISVQHSKPEPRFQFWGYEAELVREVYYMNTIGGGFRQWPVTRAHNYGVSLIGRFWQRRKGPVRAYLEVGWGLDYINRLTYDVYFRLNSSPVIGGGVTFESGGHEFQIGVRWKHLSNAGLSSHNEGENYLSLLLGLRF